MNAKMYMTRVFFGSAMVLAVVLWAQTSSIKKEGESSEMKEILTRERFAVWQHTQYEGRR